MMGRDKRYSSFSKTPFISVRGHSTLSHFRTFTVFISHIKPAEFPTSATYYFL